MSTQHFSSTEDEHYTVKSLFPDSQKILTGTETEQPLPKSNLTEILKTPGRSRGSEKVMTNLQTQGDHTPGDQEPDIGVGVGSKVKSNPRNHYTGLSPSAEAGGK